MDKIVVTATTTLLSGLGAEFLSLLLVQRAGFSVAPPDPAYSAV